MDKFRSFAVTIRPVNGVNNVIEARFMKYVKLHSLALVVAEKSGHERHLHFQFWFDDPKTKGDVVKQMRRIQESCDPDWDQNSRYVCAKGVTHAYNDDWMDSYLSENNPDKTSDSHDIIYKNIPEDTSIYYPSAEYQKTAKNIASQYDKKFAKLNLEYLQWLKAVKGKHIPYDPEAPEHDDMLGVPSPSQLTNTGYNAFCNKHHEKFSYYSVCFYLSWRMYEKHDMKVLTSKKAKKELSLALYYYIGGNTPDSVKSFMDTSASEEQYLYPYEEQLPKEFLKPLSIED